MSLGGSPYRRGPLRIVLFQVATFRRQLLEVCKHAEFRMCPRFVDEQLRYAALCHLVLDVVETDFVLADVVGHVAVGVDRQQVRPSRY